MYTILIAYAVNGLISVFSNEVETINSYSTKVDLNKNPGFAPANASYIDEPGFNLAFGFNSGESLDPSIGTWEISHKTTKKTKDENGKEVKERKEEKFDVKRCTDNEKYWTK